MRILCSQFKCESLRSNQTFTQGHDILLNNTADLVEPELIFPIPKLPLLLRSPFC